MCVAACRRYRVNASASVILLPCPSYRSVKAVKLNALKCLVDTVASASGKISRIVKAIFFMRGAKIRVIHVRLLLLFVEHIEAFRWSREVSYGSK